MPRLALALMLVLAACSAGGTQMTGEDHPLAGTVWDMATGQRIAPEALAGALAGAEYAILGEIHDNPEHHSRQAWLTERIAPAGIAFEMIPEASEEGIAVFLDQGGARPAIGPAIGWERLGWPDWTMYAPILAAAPDAYVAGGGVARPALREAIRAGAASAFGTGAAAYGLTEALAPDLHDEMEAEMIASHCNRLPAEMAGGMVESQRLRDARFAHAVRRAAAAGGGRAVLITGNGHARTDRGVPAALAAAEPRARILALGQIEVREGSTTLAAYGAAPGLPYDFVWFSRRVERGDPCAVFDE